MRNIFAIILIISCFLSCKKDKDTKNKDYKISEDICFVCTKIPFYIMEDDTIQINTFVTPNHDGYNDCLKIRKLDTITTNYSISISLYDREGTIIFNSQNYTNDWPTFIPSQLQQNIEGLTSGLYKFKIICGIKQLEGFFIIILYKDDYFDKHITELPCIDDCMFFEFGDPMLIF
jgi:gliding motility-associated-like protein